MTCRTRMPIGNNRRTARNLVGRDLASQAYRSYSSGVNGNPLAPLFAHGDGGMGDTTFISGVDGPVQFPRQPVVVKAANGDILAFCQVHENSTSATGDGGISAIMMRRSTDKGVTFGAWQIVYHETAYVRGVIWINFGTVAVNQRTGRIHVLFTHNKNGDAAVPPLPASVNDIDAYWMYSDDHGATWSAASDISASVKKASGTTAPFGKTNGAWGWYIFGPAKGIQLRNGANAGRMMFPADHRYITGTDGDGTTNISWSHVVWTDDDGATWGYSGVNETAAANDFSNELSIAEYGSSGGVFGWLRVVSGTGQNYKCSTRSTDGGVTWDNVTINDGTGGTTNLGTSSTQGCVEGMTNGDLYAMFVGDTAIRANVSIAKSTDGGLTWPTRRVLDWKLSAYSALLAVDNGSLFAAWESVPHVTQHTAASYNPCQYILARRLPTSWVSDTTPDSFYWVFNDFTGTPTATQVVGQAIKDRGTTKQVHARMSAGGTFGASGIVTDGSALACALCERNYNGATQAALPGPLDIKVGEDWTLEITDLTSTASSGAHTLIDNRNGSGAGWAVTQVVGTNKLSFALGDNAAHAATASSGVAINDGVPRDVRIYYSAAANTIQIYFDGVASGSAGSTATISGNTNAPADTVIGGRTGGSQYTAFSCSSIRITRGVPSSFLNGSEAKDSLSTVNGYTVTTPATLPSSASLAKLFVAATYDGGWACGLDNYGGWDKGALPLLAGSGYQSYRDLASGKFFVAQSQNQGLHWSSDAFVGYHHRPSFYAESANGAWRISSADLGTLIDGLQSSGKFTLLMAFKVEADTGNNQTLFATNDNNTSSNGINLMYLRSNATTGTLNLRIVGTSAAPAKVNIINETITGTTMTVGTWYLLALVGSGFGAKVKVYLGAFTSGPTAPNFGGTFTVQSSANLTDPAGTAPYAAGMPLAIGARTDAASAAFNGRMKNVVLLTSYPGSDNDVLAAAEIQNWANFTAAY